MLWKGLCVPEVNAFQKGQRIPWMCKLRCLVLLTCKKGYFLSERELLKHLFDVNIGHFDYSLTTSITERTERIGKRVN
jgi:hypothetical protein